MKISKLGKIGLVVLVTLLVAIWGLNFLKGRDILSLETMFYGKYKNVSGLTKSSSVVLKGYKIGYVSDIELSNRGAGDIVVSIAVTEDVAIPTNSIMRIVSLDLMGTKGVEMDLTNSNIYHKSGDTLIADVEPDFINELNEQLTPIKVGAESVILKLDTVLSAVSKILDEDTQKHLRDGLGNFDSTLSELNRALVSLNGVIDGVDDNLITAVEGFSTIADTLSSSSADMGNIIRNVSELSDSIVTSEIVSNLGLILAKLEQGDGSAGKILNDEEAYNKIVETIESLNMLISEITNNPGRYLKFSAMDFGKPRYIVTPYDMPVVDNISYRVCYGSNLTDTQKSKLGAVEEIVEKGRVVYYSSSTPIYKSVVEQYNREKGDIAEISIAAFKSGKKIKLDKALKSASRDGASN